MVVIPTPRTTVAGLEATAHKIEIAMHLMLVPHEDVVADDLASFEIAAAMEAGCIVDVAGSIIDRGLRIWTKRTSAAGGGCGRAPRCQQRFRSNSVFHPVHEGSECTNWTGSGASAAMSNPGSPEQTVEVLKIHEVRFMVRAVTRRHLAVVVDYAAREDQMIVGAHPGDHFAAVRLEPVQWSERVRHIGNVS